MESDIEQAEDIRSVALRSVAAIATGSEEEFRAVIAADAVNRESGNEPPSCRGRGPAAFHATALWLRDAFEDLQYDVEHVVVEGSLVVVDTTMRGRHTGPFVLYDEAGRVDAVQAPTGRTFAVRQTHWFTVVDGRVTEHWAVRDDLGQALQLHWVPPTPTHLIRSARAKRRAIARNAVAAR